MAFKIPHTVKINNEVEKTKTLIIEFENKREVEKIKSLIIEFENKRSILSTREGFKEVKYVGNHSIPEIFWDKIHNYKDYESQVLNKIGIKKRKEIVLLFTGANMDNLAIAKEKFDKFYVVAFTTVELIPKLGNNIANRLGNNISNSIEKDYIKKDYIEKDIYLYKTKNIKLSHMKPIKTNIILITNANLTERAMDRVITTIIKVITDVSQELNIRSINHPKLLAAGIYDNIIVVKGFGKEVDYTGRHTKIEEIIAKVVKRSIIEALKKIN